MRLHLFKMLMNQEGASPGGGAIPPNPGTPNPVPGAQGTPSAGITLDQVKGLLGDFAGQMKNGIFADLRKAGVFKGGKDPAPDDGGNAGGDPPKPNPSPSGLDAAGVQKLIARETAFERLATEHKLTDGQRKHAKSALDAANPDDVSAWTTTFLTELGIVKAPPAPQPNGGAGNGAPLKSPSITDRGVPARDSSLNHEGQVWKMTQTDVDALVKEKGSFQAAAHELRNRLRHDLKGVRIVFPRPGS